MAMLGTWGHHVGNYGGACSTRVWRAEDFKVEVDLSQVCRWANPGAQARFLPLGSKVPKYEVYMASVLGLGNLAWGTCFIIWYSDP